MSLSSPLTLIRILEFLEKAFIFLFPVALVLSITFTGVLIYSGIIVFFLLLILKQKKELFNSGLSIIDFAFIIYIFAFSVSKLINSGAESGLSTFLRVSQDYFIFLWLSCFLTKNEKGYKMVRILLLIAALISITYGIFQFFNLDFFHRQVTQGRLSGFHKNPYSYGGQLIVFFFFLLGLYKSEIKKLLLFPILAICLFCILNTSERAVIFGVLVGIIIYFLIQRIEKTKVIPLLLLFSLPVILTFIVNKKLMQRIRKVTSVPSNGIRNVRLKLWEIAISICKKNIFFGVGNFPKVYYQPENSFPVQVLTHAHNVYLQILVTNGLFGLLAYLNLLFSILKASFSQIKTNQYATCLIAIIFSFFVEGFFEFFWGDSEVRYLIIYFLGFVLGNIRQSKG